MEETTEKITYESLWKAIIRPPRDYFREEDLGATIFSFSGRSYIRIIMKIKLPNYNSNYLFLMNLLSTLCYLDKLFNSNK